MSAPGTIDVSRLPDTAFDTRAPLWWGNLWVIVILTTFTVMLAASYFYLRRNFEQWPPPQVNRHPAIAYPLPALGMSSANTALLLLSCLAVYYVDRSARRMRQWPLRVGLLVVVSLGVIALLLRYWEFGSIKFRWDENAYGSVVWGILISHMVCIFAAMVAMLVMTIWGWMNPLDEKHALDVSIMSVFWYWMAGIWLPLYVIVYWSPRWF